VKALVLREYNRLVYDDVPDPVADPGEVLVQVHACGICGSDVHGMDGSTGRRIPPLVMGHEAAGRIAALGPGVSGWHTGDRVTFDSTVSCGSCWHCRRGEINLCDNRRVLGVSCSEYRRDGAFAQLVAVPSAILYRLPDAIGFSQAAMAEAVAVAVHAVHRLPRGLGDSVLVVGAGVIGLLVVQVLRAAGFGRIVAADVATDRRELATRGSPASRPRRSDWPRAGASTRQWRRWGPRPRCRPPSGLSAGGPRWRLWETSAPPWTCRCSPW
jgi:L-iditol 2-dehydrogenase